MGPCMCGDIYCGSCGPAQGYHKCEHGEVEGYCDVEGCYNYGNPDAVACEECGSLKTRITGSGEAEQSNYQPAGFTDYHCDDCGHDWTEI